MAYSDENRCSRAPQYFPVVCIRSLAEDTQQVCEIPFKKLQNMLSSGGHRPTIPLHRAMMRCLSRQDEARCGAFQISSKLFFSHHFFLFSAFFPFLPLIWKTYSILINLIKIKLNLMNWITKNYCKDYVVIKCHHSLGIFICARCCGVMIATVEYAKHIRKHPWVNWLM